MSEDVVPDLDLLMMVIPFDEELFEFSLSSCDLTEFRTIYDDNEDYTQNNFDVYANVIIKEDKMLSESGINFDCCHHLESLCGQCLVFGTQRVWERTKSNSEQKEKRKCRRKQKLVLRNDLSVKKLKDSVKRKSKNATNERLKRKLH